MIKTWILFYSIAITMAASAALAKGGDTETISGEIVAFTGLHQLWFQVDDMDIYKKVSEKSKYRHKKPKHKAFLVEIYGVDQKYIEDVIDPDKDKQYHAILMLNETAKGRKAEIKCVGRNKSDRLPICELFIDETNFGLYLVAEGYSNFRPEKIFDSATSKNQYREALSNAKEGGLGIWEPYYGLFMGEYE